MSLLPETIGIGSDFGETGGLASRVSFMAATIPSPTTRESKLRGDFFGSEGHFGDLGEEERKRERRFSWGFDMGVDLFGVIGGTSVLVCVWWVDRDLFGL